MTRLAAVALALLTGLAAGCGGGDTTVALRKEIIEAKDETARQQARGADLQRQIQAQQEQIQTLQGLGGPGRLEKLFTVSRIQIGSNSGPLDPNNTGVDTELKIYVEPVDQYGCVIKAAGDVTIQLFDLAQGPEQNLLGSYIWKVDKISDRWVNGLMSTYYAFDCPWKSAPPTHDQITARVVYTDYLTGKRFEAQQVFKVKIVGK